MDIGIKEGVSESTIMRAARLIGCGATKDIVIAALGGEGMPEAIAVMAWCAGSTYIEIEQRSYRSHR